MRILLLFSRVAWIPAAVACIATSYGGADCAELKQKAPEELATYLTRLRASTDNGCVVYAIKELGNRHHVAATEMLVRYLDYQVVLPTKLSGFTRTERYPAISALFVLGKPAIAPLVMALSNEDTPDVVRENAILTLLTIYGENMADGVGRLVEASRNATDNAASERLVRAARAAADTCPPKWRPGCLSALQ